MIKLKDILNEAQKGHIFELEADKVLTTRRTPEERQKNYGITLQKKVDQYVKEGSRGDLDLTGAPENLVLPKDFNVWGDLDLARTKLKTLPEGLVVDGNLWIEQSDIETLPEYLRVYGSLSANQSKLVELPEGFVAEGNLHIVDVQIKRFPSDFKIGRNINAFKSGLEQLPEGLTVKGTLRLGHTPLRKLPNNLTVKGDLDIADTNVDDVPENLNIEGRLTAYDCPIGSLSQGDLIKLIKASGGHVQSVGC